MKYFSEILERPFDTVEELEEAENALAASVSDSTEQKEKATVDEKPTKKKLASDVEQAEEALRKAYSDYEIAKKQVEEISNAYLEEVDRIIKPAKKAIRDAEQAKYDAISRFNKEYGPYQVIYTGSRAAEDMLKAVNDLNARSANFFNRLFWN